MKNITINLFAIIILQSFVLAFGQSKYVSMGDKSFDGKQYTLAINYYNKALTKFEGDKPEKNHVIFNLAECYRLTNQPKKAESNYLRLIKSKIGDEKHEVYLYYAESLHSQGRYAEACDAYGRYLIKVPNDKLALERKAGCEAYAANTPDENWRVSAVKELNSKDDDFAAVYADKKANTVIFTSTRKGATGKEKDNWTNGYFSDFFISTFGKNGLYSSPIPADNRELLNTKANEGTGCFDAQFKKFYFTKCERMNKQKEYCGIYETNRTGNTWSRPQLIYADSAGNAGHPAVSSDGLWMIIASARTGGYGGKDLWKLTRPSERKPFDKIENLGSKINTAGDEVFPGLANDTLLFFASNGMAGMGGLDIYKVILGNDGVSQPQHLPSPINSPADDFAMYFEKGKDKGIFSSRREGGKGGDDIYAFEKLKRKAMLTGKLTNEKSDLPLKNFKVVLISPTLDTSTFSTDESGVYFIDNAFLKEETQYEISITHIDYFASKTIAVIGKLEKDTTYTINFSLIPIPEKPIVLPDIYYELNKWELLPRYQDSLLVLVRILQDNPNLSIELASHTDSRASQVYNDTLSLKRAETVVAFLVEKGINKDRLTAIGYGEKVPRELITTIVKNGFVFERGTILSELYILAIKDEKKREAAHELNRRTEFKVVSRNFQK